MGYTHYWTKPALTGEALLEIGEVVTRMIKAIEGKPVNTAGGFHKEPLQVCGGDGTGKPVISETEIALNGNGPELDHETFAIRLAPDRDFCKTARKPYDIIVVGALAYCAHKHGFSVSSDGDPADWEGGVELVNQVAGEPIPNPLIVDALTA